MREKIRFSAVGGQFYPGEKENLEKMIENFLKETQTPEIKGEIFGILVPHAGYIFSGFVAAHCYKAIEGKEFKTVILIGDSHYERFEGVAVWERGEWETPLGKIKVDENLAQKILKRSERFFVRDSAHIFEHSLEVQLPFLQKILKNFKILPLIFGSEDKDWKELAKTILEILKEKKILIVTSSDLSHYPPYEMAKKVDFETIDAILSSNPEIFKEKVEKLEREFPQISTFCCAQDSVKTILEISKSLRGKPKLLKYQNSGDTVFGEKFQVVGYGGIIFLK